MFTAAALAAVLTNLPLRYGEPSAETLSKLLDAWGDSKEDWEIAVASAQTKVVASAKRNNAVKAGLLFLAVGCELVAVGAIADAVLRAL